MGATRRFYGSGSIRRGPVRRTRYAELIDSPGLARPLMRSLPMSLRASFCRQKTR
jgi:hypothetical protein